jgi:hypothetical protein
MDGLWSPDMSESIRHEHIGRERQIGPMIAVASLKHSVAKISSELSSGAMRERLYHNIEPLDGA